MAEDNYFKVHSRQEQLALNAVKFDEILDEPKDETKYKKRRNGQRIRNAIILKESELQIKEMNYYE